MKPMLAKDATPRQINSGLFLTSPDWLLQVKIDGERRLVVCDGAGGVTALNRDGEITGLPTPVRQVLAQVNLPVTLDGELLGGSFWVWEAPRFADQIDERSRCIDRCTVAFGIAQQLASDRVQFVPTAVDADAKDEMVQRVLDGHGEGVMAKLVSSRYEPGRRSRSWVKVKQHHTIDCVVDWIGDDKENMGLVVFTPDGRRVDVGEIGRAQGDGHRCRAGDVVEVTVVHVSADGRLVQPKLPRIRTDKAPADCLTTQLAAAATDKNLIYSWKDR